MRYNFDQIIDRRDSESSKWGLADADVLPMWVADMDFKSPEFVIESLKRRVEHGIFGYALQPDGLKESIIEWISKRHCWNVNVEDIILVPGVVSGFNLAAHAVTRPGDGVVIQTPAYGPFFNVARNTNLIQQTMKLRKDEDGNYHVDYERFESCLTGRSRIFMLCNPQNPTGRVFNRTELESMAEICLKNNIIICSDEIHSDLIFSGKKHIPMASLSPEIAANTITLIAPSKTFNIAGLDTSVAVISDDGLRKRFIAARKGLLGNVNLFGQYAMLSAYQGGENWLDELLIYLETNRNYLYEYVNNNLPGIQMAKPEGTFLGWLDCRNAKIETKPSMFFKEKAKVMMNDGEWFGKGYEGFTRINFGCPRKILKDALGRMKEALLENGV